MLFRIHLCAQKTVRPGKNIGRKKMPASPSLFIIVCHTSEECLEKPKLFVLEEEVDITSSIKYTFVAWRKKPFVPEKRK